MNNLMLYIIIAILFTLTGCGTQAPVTVVKKGVFLDSSYVSGLRYKCGEYSGVTDGNGIFVFDTNVKQCEFYLGKNKFLVSPYMLQDRIITPFEITTSIPAGLQLSRILQSLGVNKDDILMLDTAKLDKLGLVDLTNPVQVAANISTISPYVKKLENVKKALSKHYDLQTGFILTPAQKKAQQIVSTNPIVIIPPSVCTGDKCNTTTPLPPFAHCPIGAVCSVDKTPFDESEVCLPGASCPKPKDATPCFPGSPCDDSASLPLSCLPGQSGVLCGTTNANILPKLCLPGQSCSSSTTLSSCLPGTPCSKLPTSYPIKTQDSPSTTSQPITDNAVCLPGANCSKSPSAGASYPIYTTPPTKTPTNCTPLPGKKC